jgi:putative phosphoesterase
VISDTHNLLRPEVADVVRTCEIVLHGGDISGPETLEKVRNLCGIFYVVRGNNDRDWASGIPYTLEVELYGRKFFMTHKKKDIPADVDADVVIYGHSHKYAQTYVDGILYLNPGSCGPRRFNQPITMAVLTVPETDTITRAESGFGDSVGTEGKRLKSYGITVEKIEIAHGPSKPAAGTTVSAKEQVSADLIRKIGADIKKHCTVAEISARRGISRELADQIVRLYVTHPGVTAEQIMSKMGL